MREIKGPRVWDDVLGKMLYSKFEQYDDSIGFRFSEHLETESPVYMWPSGLKDKNGVEIYEGIYWTEVISIQCQMNVLRCIIESSLETEIITLN